MQAISAAIELNDRRHASHGFEALARAGVRTIEIFGSLGDAAGAWTALQELGACSPYQRFAWAEAWCGTVGAACRQSPIIAAAFDGCGRPIALFPFVRDWICGFRVGCFVGGKESNGNLALFADPAAWDGPALGAVLGAIGQRAGLDLFWLRNQPQTWEGRPNPMSALPRQPSPSGVAVSDLREQRPLSKQARKRLRQKTGWLEALGPVTFRHAQCSQEIDEVLAAHVAHRTARAGMTGVAPPSAAQLAFYRRAADLRQPGGATLELHALTCGGEIVATFGGTGFRGSYSGLILSAEMRPEVARCSPGELLLRRLVADLPGRGVTRFDLGVGEAHYKNSFCEAYAPLFDSFAPVTRLGGVAALALSTGVEAKRRIKRSEAGIALRRRLAILVRRAGAGRVSRP